MARVEPGGCSQRQGVQGSLPKVLIKACHEVNVGHVTGQGAHSNFSIS